MKMFRIVLCLLEKLYFFLNVRNKILYVELVLIKILGSAYTLESSSNKIEQRYTIDNANEMYYNPFPIAPKLYPHF